MQTRTEKPQTGNSGHGSSLDRPAARCLCRDEAAAYLGIGITLLESLGVPVVKFGRRSVYDRVDLDAWLDDYKHRGRARKESKWPVKPESTGDETRVSGGLMWYYPVADAYAKALGLKTEMKPKRSSQG